MGHPPDGADNLEEDTCVRGTSNKTQCGRNPIMTKKKKNFSKPDSMESLSKYQPTRDRNGFKGGLIEGGDAPSTSPVHIARKAIDESVHP